MRPRSGGTGRLGTAPPVFAPHPPGRPPEARQVDQPDDGPLLDPGPDTARLAPGRLGPGLDVHHDRGAELVIDGKDGHIGQADKQLAHARSVGLHGGSGGSTGVGTADSPSPRAAGGGPPLRHHTPLISEAPAKRGFTIERGAAHADQSIRATRCDPAFWNGYRLSMSGETTSLPSAARGTSSVATTASSGSGP